MPRELDLSIPFHRSVSHGTSNRKAMTLRPSDLSFVPRRKGLVETIRTGRAPLSHPPFVWKNHNSHCCSEKHPRQMPRLEGTSPALDIPPSGEVVASSGGLSCGGRWHRWYGRIAGSRCRSHLGADGTAVRAWKAGLVFRWKVCPQKWGELSFFQMCLGPRLGDEPSTVAHGCRSSPLRGPWATKRPLDALGKRGELAVT